MGFVIRNSKFYIRGGNQPGVPIIVDGDDSLTAPRVYGDVTFLNDVTFSAGSTVVWVAVGFSGNDNEVAFWNSAGSLPEGDSNLIWENYHFCIDCSSGSADLNFGGNANREILILENPGTSTDGGDLQIAAGDANSGSTFKNGGQLTLKSGTYTGSHPYSSTVLYLMNQYDAGGGTPLGRVLMTLSKSSLAGAIGFFGAISPQATIEDPEGEDEEQDAINEIGAVLEGYGLIDFEITTTATSPP